MPLFANMNVRSALVTIAAVVTGVLVAGLGGCATQQSFDSPEAATEALNRAVQSNERSQLVEVLGPRVDELKSGDAVQDRGDFAAFAYKLNQKTQFQPESDDRTILLVGEEAWAFPAPLVQSNGRWSFDTAAGIDEMTTRRIGANELAVIEAVDDLVDAEYAYRAIDAAASGAGTGAFAGRFLSSPGTRDGLYWETGENESPSPIGPVMAASIVGPEGAGAAQPFYGYFFRILTSQSAAAPGGAMDYREEGRPDGRLVNGFAAVAFPAEYGRSGIMTFITSMDGVLYQRDLGPQTDSIARAMTEFNPDENWTVVGEYE